MNLPPSDWVTVAMFIKFIIDGTPYITILFIAK